MPVQEDGTYHIASIVEWNVTRNIKKMEKSLPDDWETKHKKIKAERAEMELEERRGHLVSKEEIEAINVRKISTLKAALLNLPKRLSSRIAGLDEAKIYDVLIAQFKEMIRNFSQGGVDGKSS